MLLYPTMVLLQVAFPPLMDREAETVSIQVKYGAILPPVSFALCNGAADTPPVTMHRSNATTTTTFAFRVFFKKNTPFFCIQ